MVAPIVHVIGGVLTGAAIGKVPINETNRILSNARDESAQIAQDIGITNPLEIDAFRHALFSAAMSNVIGIDISATLGTSLEYLSLLRENNGEISLEDQTRQDLFSNAFGRWIVLEGIPIEQWADTIKNAIDSGFLIIDPVNDQRSYPEDFNPPPNLIPDNPTPTPNTPSPGGGGNGRLLPFLPPGLPPWLPPWFPCLGRNFFDYISPLTVDVDGDGTEVTELNGSFVQFDLNNNGFAQQTAWLSPDDAFIVRDHNSNGFIDNGNELFGNYTLNPDGTTNETGFQALGYFDTNADGIIDANDAVFEELQLWHDLNQNGISEANELQTLEEAGLVSIGLDIEEVNIFPLQPEEFYGKLIYSHNIYEQTQATWEDSTTTNVHDVWFADLEAVSQFIPPADFELNSEALTIPNLQGYGTIPDLVYALSTDDELLEQAEELLSLVSQGDLAGFLEAFEPFMLNWVGVKFDFSENNQSYFGSTHQTEFLRIVFTEDYEDFWNPSSAQAYNTIKESMALRFLVQACE